MERRLKDRFPPKFEAECTKRVPSALFFPIFSRAREKIGPPEAPAAANLQQSIPQARSLCHYWYASSLYTREPLKRTARSTAEMWNTLSVSLGADSSPGRGAFLCAKQRAEGGCGEKEQHGKPLDHPAEGVRAAEALLPVGDGGQILLRGGGEKALSSRCWRRSSG